MNTGVLEKVVVLRVTVVTVTRMPVTLVVSVSTTVPSVTLVVVGLGNTPVVLVVPVTTTTVLVAVTVVLTTLVVLTVVRMVVLAVSVLMRVLVVVLVRERVAETVTWEVMKVVVVEKLWITWLTRWHIAPRSPLQATVVVNMSGWSASDVRIGQFPATLFPETHGSSVLGVPTLHHVYRLSRLWWFPVTIDASRAPMLWQAREAERKGRACWM